jgi:Cornifin (SPRR) family
LIARFAESAQAAQNGQEDPMAIWGHRDSEPPAEEAPETEFPAQADETQAPAGTEQHSGEPASALWQAQGDAPPPFGQAPAQAPPPAYGYVAADTPAPADDEDAVVLEGEVVNHGAPADQAGTHEADAGEPGMAQAQEPIVTEAPEPAVTDVAEPAMTEAPEPAVTDIAEPAMTEVPEPAVTDVPEPAAAEAASPGSPGETSPQHWSEILATFVDDPRGSVRMAADAVDAAIDEFVTSVRARQQGLASSWQGTETDTDTEQLRGALRDYRKFWHQVRQLDLSGKTVDGTGR